MHYYQSEMPSDPILEGLYKSKLQNSAQLRTVMALYDQVVARNIGTPNYQQLKTAVKLKIDQMMRNWNFKARNDVVERSSPRFKRFKSMLRGKRESVFSVKHKDNVLKETHVVSVMTFFWLLETEVVVRDENDDRLLLHPIQRQYRLTEKKATRRKVLTREVRSCVEKNCNDPSCKFWYLPVCLKYKSEKDCVYGDKSASDMLRNT